MVLGIVASRLQIYTQRWLPSLSPAVRAPVTRGKTLDRAASLAFILLQYMAAPKPAGATQRMRVQIP